MSDTHEWDAITYRSRSRQRLEYKLGAKSGYFHRHPVGKGLPHEVQGEVCAELLRLKDALSVAEGENTKLRETLANVYKVPGVISAVGDHVEKARNGGSENG